MKKLLTTLAAAIGLAASTFAATINLANVTGSTTLANGDVATGTLGGNYKISIADGATVTLNNAVITNGINDAAYPWAGLTCLGDATIVLQGTNVVASVVKGYPGIYIPQNKTLTISGGGSLDANGAEDAAGIGAGGVQQGSCGDIVIEGGKIKARGGYCAAGIGGGYATSCGDITITGGNIDSRGTYGAGIGSGYGANSSCGNITLGGCSVYASGWGGESAQVAAIGSGYRGTCGNITFNSDVIYIEAVVALSSGLVSANAGRAIGAGANGSCGLINVMPGLFDNNGVSFRIIRWDGNLASVTGDKVAGDYVVITGTLAANVKISIADGATVTISNATIVGANNEGCKWAGLNCLGDATIILKGTNTVCGFYEDYPGIHVPANSTLRIQGSGRLVASSNGYGAGIGGGYGVSCGNISIEGGDICATGGSRAAGIGGGGTGNCGTISIGNGISRVEATHGDTANFAIGGGFGGNRPRVDVASWLDDDNGNPTRIILSWGGDLSKVTRSVTVKDGMTLTGELGVNCQVSIEPNATVTLKNAVITNGVNDEAYSWAGLTCQSNATLILAGRNYVKGFYEDYPGIFVPVKSTLTIDGDGMLNAYGSIGSQNKGWAAGIGGGYGISCGNISIAGGFVVATGGAGGSGAAGIGSGSGANCGLINIGAGIFKVVATCGGGTSQPIGSSVVNATVASGLSDDRGSPTRTIGWNGNLATLARDVIIPDDMTIYGTLRGNYKVSIADGVTVTLSGVSINDGGELEGDWAGITCLGDATIVLVEENCIVGVGEGYPGIYIPSSYAPQTGLCPTLTIKGNGSLIAATRNGGAAAIGSGSIYNENDSCGNIVIEGGAIVATGDGGAGIGGSDDGSCGDITIIGGDVTARGGLRSAGIGGGAGGYCGDITIGPGIFRVVAEWGTDSDAIGAGDGGKCGEVTLSGLCETTSGNTRTYVPWNGNLTVLAGDAWADNGMTLSGTLGGNYKVSIADGATVTLSDVTINRANNSSCKWAGLTCVGDATINLAAGTANTVKGFYEDYPGIYVPSNKTLTVQGTGALDASSNGWGAGIGGGYEIPCGNIVINGGTITAAGGSNAAGIGAGNYSDCGDIVINGGTITATGGSNAAGIGAGNYSDCGDISVYAGVAGDTRVVATRGGQGADPVGSGANTGASGVGSITIGSGLTCFYSEDGATCAIQWDGNLAALPGNRPVAYDGTIIYGTLTTNVQVSIAAGATVTLSNAVINRTGEYFDSPGLRCLGDATILLDGANNISGFDGDRSGILVPDSYRLVISNLNANASLDILRTDLGGAGIGGGYDESCGDIDICGGVITVVGGYYSAGIGGGGQDTSCGTIRIMGGTINATGGFRAAGIGSSMGGSCTGVAIEGGTVSATGGGYGAGIGAGDGNGSGHPASCGGITVGSGIARVTATCDNSSDIEPIGHGAEYSIGGGITVSMSLADDEGHPTRTITGSGTGSAYEVWAAANGVSGAWNATDANGIANVFRYAFNKPTGAFTEPVLLDITFNAAGKAVIKTPPLVNSAGFTFTIEASDNVGGTGNAASYPLDASGETVIDETGKTTRFFRLKAVAQ